MLQIPGLYILHDPFKGRGVYTSNDIKKGEVIEVCHIIKLSKEELPIIHRTTLHDYYFLWGNDLEDFAIALGFGSLYNHKINPNANFILDIQNETIDFEAIVDISEGTEITINYHGEPGDGTKLWF